MGDSESNLGNQNIGSIFFESQPYKPDKLPPIPKKRANYLEKEVKYLGFWDQMTHFGSRFTNKEKEQFWRELPDRKYKIGLLRSKDLDTVITIFTEHFDFSKKLKPSIAGVQSFSKHECGIRGIKGNDIEDELEQRKLNLDEAERAAARAAAEEEERKKSGSLSDALASEAEVLKDAEAVQLAEMIDSSDTHEKRKKSYDEHYYFEGGAEASGAAAKPEAAKPETKPETKPDAKPETKPDAKPEPEPPKAEAKAKGKEERNSFLDTDLTRQHIEGAFDLDEFAPPVQIDTAPQEFEIFTSSDFERKYLGWLNDPKITTMSDADKQKRRNTMKSLFRFVFGTKKISEATATTYQKKYRIAYTPLRVDEKLPCNTGLDDLWIDFRKSLDYRRRMAMCELYATRDLISDRPLYTVHKKQLILGLRDIINVLDQSTYECMEYGYDPSQHNFEDGGITEEEYSRLLKVFKRFVEQRKEKKLPYTHNELRLALSKPGTPKEKSIDLYNNLLHLLIWTSGDGLANQKLRELEEQVRKLQELAKEQGKDISELEDLVLLLSIIIVLSEKLFTLKYAIQELKTKMNISDEERRKATKKLLDELERENKTYKDTVENLLRTKKQHGDDIQELEDTVLALSEFIISIEKFNTLEKGVSNLKKSMEIRQEYLQKLKDYRERLDSMRESFAMKEKTPKTMAAEGIINSAIGVADEIGTKLANQENKQTSESNLGMLLKADGVAPAAPAAAPALTPDVPLAPAPLAPLAPDAAAAAPAPDQSGGSNKSQKTFCDTMLAFLLLEAKRNKSLDVNTFLKKVGKTLDELGDCPLVLESLNEIIDKSMDQDVKEDGYVFSTANTEKPEFASRLEEVYAENFSDSEKETLAEMNPTTYHAKSPQEFEEILGSHPYFLSKATSTAESDDKGDVRLYGMEYDDLFMTPDEHEKIGKGGVPLGGLVILYLASLQKAKSQKKTNND